MQADNNVWLRHNGGEGGGGGRVQPESLKNTCELPHFL